MKAHIIFTLDSNGLITKFDVPDHENRVSVDARTSTEMIELMDDLQKKIYHLTNKNVTIAVMIQ